MITLFAKIPSHHIAALNAVKEVANGRSRGDPIRYRAWSAADSDRAGNHNNRIGNTEVFIEEQTKVTKGLVSSKANFP